MTDTRTEQIPYALRCEGLSRTYGSGVTLVTALADATLGVRAGELVILRGPSGSGKTTLLNLLGGLDVPTAGRVWLGERELTSASEQELVETRRDDIGYVFQSFALLPVLSAAENVELPLRIVETPAAEREARVAELLDLVGLSDHAAQRPYELSGGQQQRVGIARALANRPRVLIADEPTGQLDSETGEAMMRLLAGLVHEQGVAALISTHDPRMATFADRILEIHDGRLDDSRRHGRRSSGATPDTGMIAVIDSGDIDSSRADASPSTPSAPDLPLAPGSASLDGSEGHTMSATSGDQPNATDQPSESDDLLVEEGPDLDESDGVGEAPDVETHGEATTAGAPEHTDPTDPLNIDAPTPDADLDPPRD